ncbi:Por secretion system C-terminal sorting domain-containing protein [Pustulibacterium marinum]|uniref:Por secretion system C-terminal sorting domain-containing protein n=1 Tax=Pustulibacterium marinum TaxID=1224947 RepID=A0A1I7FCN8_9FLAO|nr:T9SS type A sorting domain-containing protein [Pustulibacterium marinum]SFU33891.1 Por secretion system C-terminal sorting domain-containing protein [Pustulibacterium marinum]
MKLKLFYIALIIGSLNLINAQTTEAPVIEGDTMLCPYSDGTASIVNDETYDSYQWYYKYWFLSGDFESIPNATSSTFEYDWYTYDQALIKVIATKNGNTYESNTIQIDSYNWAGLLVEHESEDDITIDQSNGNFIMCPGDELTNTISQPYTIAQWYKDGQAIEGATNTTFVITEPGDYYVTAAPEYCPDVTQTSPTYTVVYGDDCGLNTDQYELETIGISNNPVTNTLSIANPNHIAIEDISIYNVNGQRVLQETKGTNINVSKLSKGFYFAVIMSEQGNTKNIKFIKE